MATNPRILVTSAAGKTGLPTALGLLERGYPVRAFARRQDARAAKLKDAGAELFVGDQFDIADLRAADYTQETPDWRRMAARRQDVTPTAA